MKESRFNYYIDREDKVLWFNGISHKFFEINKSLSDKLKSNISRINSTSPTLFDKLFGNGFIVMDDTDEVSIIREANRRTRLSKDYFLIILPTLNCNFSCWYCIQDHKVSIMDGATINKVKNHIAYMIKEEKIESLHIEWFGGEPFMYFESVIKTISKYAIKLCQDADIPFINSATTNGYYLTENIISELEQLKFFRFQITIDGNRTNHNRVKRSNDTDSAFDVTMKNINQILSSTEAIDIILRLNYQDKNLHPSVVDDVNLFIHRNNRARVLMLLRRIWKIEPSKGRGDAVKNILRLFRSSGYKMLNIDIENDFIRCYADKKYYNTINYNGDVVKCTANGDLETITPPGHLKSNGQIEWREGFLDKFYKMRFENDMCLSCRHLPLCMGNCARNYNEESDENSSGNCLLPSLDLNFETVITNYYENNF